MAMITTYDDEKARKESKYRNNDVIVNQESLTENIKLVGWKTKRCDEKWAGKSSESRF
jgi:hypothetical protein